MSAIAVKVFEHGSTSAAPVELGSLTDPVEHGLSGLAGDETREVQVVQLPRATQVSVFDRANRSEGITLNIHKEHASLGDALRWWLLHPRSVPILVDVSFTQDGAEVWLNAAGIRSVRRQDRPGGGVTTIFSYDLVGGAWGPTRGTNYESSPNLA